MVDDLASHGPRHPSRVTIRDPVEANWCGKGCEWLVHCEFSVVTIGDPYVSPDMERASVDAFILRNDVTGQAAQSGGAPWED